MHKCPLHGTKFRQLGTTPGDGKWHAENLWNCPDCKWPDDSKVFMTTDDGLKRAEV